MLLECVVLLVKDPELETVVVHCQSALYSTRYAFASRHRLDDLTKHFFLQLLALGSGQQEFKFQLFC